MIDLYEGIAYVLGLGTEGEPLGHLQLTARAVALYLVTLGLIRLGRSRSLGGTLAFDVVLGFLVGSLLTQAIRGDGALFQTGLASAVMLAVHGVVRLVSAREASLVGLRPSEPHPLEGPPSGDDLALVAKDRVPTLLYGGGISVLQPPGEPRVLEVHVADGVQTVRIALC